MEQQQICAAFSSTSGHGQESRVLFKAEVGVGEVGVGGETWAGDEGGAAHISPSARFGPNAVTAGDK